MMRRYVNANYTNEIIDGSDVVVEKKIAIEQTNFLLPHEK